MSKQTPETPIKLTLQLPPRLLVILGLVWAGVVFIFTVVPTWRAEIVFAASSLGGIAAIAGAFYLARSLIITAEQRERVERERKIEAAFRFLERWNSPQFYYAKNASREVLRLGTDEGAEQLTARLINDAPLRSNITDFMNFFEELALAIKIGVADDEILRKSFRGPLASYWMTLEHFITHRRTALGNPRILVECEELHRRWA